MELIIHITYFIKNIYRLFNIGDVLFNNAEMRRPGAVRYSTIL